MKWLVRRFFRALRLVLTPFMLLWEWMSTPRGVVQTPEHQAALDAQTGSMALYQFRTCPFCIKVRREIKRLGLNIELRDAQHDDARRAELLQGGGQIKVPCLRLVDAQGQVQWMYESADIIAYLQQRFG